MLRTWIVRDFHSKWHIYPFARGAALTRVILDLARYFIFLLVDLSYSYLSAGYTIYISFLRFYAKEVNYVSVHIYAVTIERIEIENELNLKFILG